MRHPSLAKAKSSAKATSVATLLRATKVEQGTQQHNEVLDVPASQATEPIHAAFPPVGEPLLDNQPKDHNLKTIFEWVNTVKRCLPAKDKVRLDDTIQEVADIWEAMETNQQPNLVTIATHWGLPHPIAKKTRPQGLLQVIAVATFLSS